MKSSSRLFLLILSAGILVGTLANSHAGRRGGFGSVNVNREGPRGGSVDVEGSRFGRFGSGSVDAEGPRGGTYDASATRVGPYRNVQVNGEGPRGGSISRSSTTWTGFRSGYVYTGGVYRPANVVVNSVYIAPIGVYAGWQILARPTYIVYPAFATYPVEVAVQVQLQQLGYYGGPIDGAIGPQTQTAIRKYQAAQDIAVTGTITQALLASLNIT